MTQPTRPWSVPDLKEIVNSAVTTQFCRDEDHQAVVVCGIPLGKYRSKVIDKKVGLVREALRRFLEDEKTRSAVGGNR